jgi:hypothetical protein
VATVYCGVVYCGVVTAAVSLAHMARRWMLSQPPDEAVLWGRRRPLGCVPSVPSRSDRTHAFSGDHLCLSSITLPLFGGCRQEFEGSSIRGLPGFWEGGLLVV